MFLFIFVTTLGPLDPFAWLFLFPWLCKIRTSTFISMNTSISIVLCI